MNFTWLYVGALYALAIAFARRAGIELLPKRIGFFFYLLVLVFFFRPLTQQYVNFQLDVLQSIPPWYHVTRDHHQFTSELNDLPLQIVPWMHQVREGWKSLTPPLWNAASGSGYPLLGNGQSSAFSLVRWLTLPLPLGRAVAAEAALKVLIALTFTFLYCRRRYSTLGSTVAAVTFAFGGFIIGWLHFPMATAACFAPAVLYAIDLMAERRTRGRFVFAAVLWTLLLFAGHPETAAHLFWLGTVYALWLVLAEKRPWRMLLALGAALAVSALLAAPYLAPLLETMRESKRVAELKEVPYSADALPYTDRNCAIVMFQPHFFGQIPWDKAWGPADTEPLGGFPGIFGWVAWIAVGLHAIVARQWRSRELFFALTTLFILGVIYAWPGIGESFHLMMPIAAHARARMIFTLLCAIQTAAIIDIVRGAAHTRGALLVAGSWFAPMRRKNSRPSEAAASVNASAANHDEPATSNQQLLLGILAAAIVLLLLSRIPMQFAWRFDTAVLGMLPGMLTLLAATVFAITRHRIAIAALLVVVIAEFFIAGRDRSMPLPDRMLYPATPLIARLQEFRARTPANEPFRITGIAAQFFPNVSAIYGFEDIRAHDPMAYARYLAFLRLTADYEPWNYFAFLNDASKPVLDFLNVRYVITDPGVPVSDPARYELVYDGRDGRILENRRVLPRFYAVRNVQLEPRPEVLYPRLRAHREWASTAFLEAFPERADPRMRNDLLQPRAPEAPIARAAIVRASTSDYALRVDAPRWSLVASSIPWWRGWKVSIDGRPVTPVRVNAVFLGFPVPPGSHDVRVWYAPLSFRAGIAAAVLAMIALGLWWRRGERATTIAT